MNAKQIAAIGVPPGEATRQALDFVARYCREGGDVALVAEQVAAVVADPAAFLGDPSREAFARALYEPPFKGRETPAPWRQWGSGLEPDAIRQMASACSLPVAVAGALMPDAHVGYGLPIGGVLATENAVIPYAVGVDIACRMRLSIFDAKGGSIAGQKDRLANIIESETRFGVGAAFQHSREHAVMDEDWSVSPVTKRMRDKAWTQLGTSGSGNHFVEFGEFVLERPALGLEPGNHLALLSHSGSRGVGAQVCQHYSRLATDRRGRLPKELAHLAWLEFSEEAGQEYWAAMELMGRYAAATSRAS